MHPSHCSLCPLYSASACEDYGVSPWSSSHPVPAPACTHTPTACTHGCRIHGCCPGPLLRIRHLLGCTGQNRTSEHPSVLAVGSEHRRHCTPTCRNWGGADSFPIIAGSMEPTKRVLGSSCGSVAPSQRCCLGLEVPTPTATPVGAPRPMRPRPQPSRAARVTHPAHGNNPWNQPCGKSPAAPHPPRRHPAHPCERSHTHTHSLPMHTLT